MTLALASLLDIAPRYKAVVLDQWGVLHDGTAAYPGVVGTLQSLAAGATRLAVLSNSGKRAAPNRQRIARMGVPVDAVDLVMTSGEAFWRAVASGQCNPGPLFAITAAPDDFEIWADGLAVAQADRPDGAGAILLMGIPEGSDGKPAQAALAMARDRDLTVFCTNPDRASPRAGGITQVSPGALAHAHAAAGGRVIFYGKPHHAVFQAVEAALDVRPSEVLMVGDSFEHDIAGAAGAGWDSCLIEGGLHAAELGGAVDLAALAHAHHAPPPTYRLASLQ